MFGVMFTVMGKIIFEKGVQLVEELVISDDV
jgi:hypothetical protein